MVKNKIKTGFYQFLFYSVEPRSGIDEVATFSSTFYSAVDSIQATDKLLLIPLKAFVEQFTSKTFGQNSLLLQRFDIASAATLWCCLIDLAEELLYLIVIF